MSEEPPQQDGRDPRLDRIRHNEELFREANSQIEDKAREVEIADPLLLLCECFDPNCVELIRVEPRDYSRVRLHPDRFFVVAGHRTDGEQVVEEAASYVILEKTGEGG